MAQKTGVDAWLEEWLGAHERKCDELGIIHSKMTSDELEGVISSRPDVRILQSCCPWDELTARAVAKEHGRFFEPYISGDLLAACGESLVYDFV